MIFRQKIIFQRDYLKYFKSNEKKFINKQYFCQRFAIKKMKRMFKQMDQTPKKRTKRVKLTEQIDELESKTQNNPQNGHKQGENQRVQNTDIKKRLNFHHLRYLLFLIEYKQDLEKDFTNEKMKWYKKMSDFIGGTTAQNCGIFHKGQLQKFQNVDQIISHFKEIVIFDRQEMINQYERIRSIIQEYEKDYQMEFQQIFTENLSEKKIQILKSQSISNLVKFQMNFPNQSDQILSSQEKSYTANSILQISIQCILIIQKQNSFQQSSNLLKNYKQEIQEAKIKEIIQVLKNKHQQISQFRKKKSELKKHISKKIIMNIQNSDNNKAFEKSYFYEPLGNIQPKQFGLKSHKPNKRRRRVFWSKAQNIKLIVFLNIVQDYIGTANKNKNFNINLKCSQYLNTNKTPVNCQTKIDSLQKKYHGDFKQMIKAQNKKFKISAYLIEKEKSQYFFPNQNIQCGIKIQFHTIQLKELTQIRNNKKIHHNLKLTPSLKFYINRQSPRQYLQKQHIEDSKVIVQKSKSKFKHLLHVKVPHDIFSLMIKKKSSNYNILKKMKRYLVLVTNQKCQMICIKQKII